MCKKKKNSIQTKKSEIFAVDHDINFQFDLFSFSAITAEMLQSNFNHTILIRITQNIIKKETPEAPHI